jgi:predicted chitinase
VEANVDLALSSDFLSPLIAGTLFPDMLQSVIPRAVGSLDRARALEYTLEAAADQMYDRKQTKLGKSASQIQTSNPARRNLLTHSFQSYWKPDGAIPALLLNATDSGSGKRVVMAPFNLQKAAETFSDVCMLTPTKSSEDFALSTAAFVSARFPWVTPAATTYSINPCIGDKAVQKIRLVDGGYIDNSGIETALDLITEMKDALKANGDPAIAQFPVYLISLSSDDFPSERAYGLNGLLEPIRALLNGREARAAIAINRARINFDIVKVDDQELPKFNRTNLQNHFYDLPLGWAMSDRTRDIIALDSGRFWDCHPNERFIQTDKDRSNADCVQLQIYHLLNNSAKSALVGLKAANEISNRMTTMAKLDGPSKERVDHESLLACYENYLQEDNLARWRKRQNDYEAEIKAAKASKKSTDTIDPPTPYKRSYLAYYQAEHVRALLAEWDQRHETIKDSSFLAYVLGSLSYDSNDFRRLTENLTFKSAAQIRSSRWASRINEINTKRRQADPASIDVDLNQYTNSPEKLAELVWGWEGNQFDNNQRGKDFLPALKEGWKYRARGVYQIVGREQYKNEDARLQRDNRSIEADLLVRNPDALWNRAIAARVAFSHFLNWRSETAPATPKPDDERSIFRKANGLERKTLAGVLSERPGEFAFARANQTDMGQHRDRNIVAQRSKMFQHCIETSPPRRSPDSLQVTN